MYVRTRDIARYEYAGLNNSPSVCRVETWEQSGCPPLLLLTELPDNPGTSLTNCIGALAAELLAGWFPEAFDVLEGVPFHVFERYPPDRFRVGHREGLAAVTFARSSPVVIGGMGWRGRLSLGTPLWTHTTRRVLEELLGCPYPEPERVDAHNRPIAGACT